jgi:hypothetical protein
MAAERHVAAPFRCGSMKTSGQQMRQFQAFRVNRVSRSARARGLLSRSVLPLDLPTLAKRFAAGRDGSRQSCASKW